MDYQKGVQAYIEEMEGILKPSTLADRKRKIPMLGRMLSELMEIGEVSTTDPERISERDARHLFDQMRKDGKDVSTFRK